MNHWAFYAGVFVLFIIWNNTPDLVERIGFFLVGHARSIRNRNQMIKDLKTKCLETPTPSPSFEQSKA